MELESQIIHLGEVSDSNSFRNRIDDTSSIFSVSIDIPSDNRPISLIKRQKQEAFGQCWRNPNLQDPSSHLPTFFEIVKPIIKACKIEKILLTTRKDEIYISFLDSEPYFHRNFLALSTIQSTTLNQIDSAIQYFTAKNTELYQLVLLRHALEHSANPFKLLASLRSTLSEGGIVIIEVPLIHFSKQQSFLEYFWEEHLSYFSASSLSALAVQSGYEIIFSQSFVTENEPVLMMILKNTPQVLDELIHSTETRQISIFCQQLIKTEVIKTRKFFSASRNSGPLVFFGANHKTVNLIDLFSESRDQTSIVDGDPNKVNKYTSKFDIRVNSIESLTSLATHKVYTTISSRKLEIMKVNSMISSDLCDSLINVYEQIRRSY